MRNVLATSLFSLLLLCACTQTKQSDLYRGTPPSIVASFDGVPISFNRFGTGETTLLFIHGWSCDSRYWREQVSFFSKAYQVVTVDLAGHGHSGLQRKKYTMQAFAKDVQAVVDALDSKRIILIGHSMGGSVMAAATQLMPSKIIGLIGVDTLQDVAYPMNKKVLEKMIRPFERDFGAATQKFVKGMFVANSDPTLVSWVVNDMAAAPPRVGVSAYREIMREFLVGEVATRFASLKVPVYAINADLWPTNIEGNRKYLSTFDATIIKNVGHFPMLEIPEEFNRTMAQTIKNIEQPALN